MSDMKVTLYEDAIGKTIASIEKTHDEITLIFSDGASVMMHHVQDCCESVYIDDICGDLEDLVGVPLIMFEETWENDETADWGSGTWTFYKLATSKGFVTIKWHGSSNGYYSEGVDVIFKSPGNEKDE